jgi:glycosyltransferase involved in cell wall biosynthesis
MRISYVIDNLYVGGAQLHMVRLAAGLRERGHDVEILALGPGSRLVAAEIPDGLAVRSFAMESLRRPAFWPAFLHLAAHLRRRRPCFVHTYLNTAGVFGLLAARLSGNPHVATSRRDMGSFRSGRVRRLEAALSRTLAAGVFCVCEAVAAETQRRERIPRSRLRVVLNGVRTNVRPRLYPTAPPLSFATVAAMDRSAKGHHDLLLAAACASARTGQAMPLTLVGDGHLRPELEALARQHGLGPSVRFLGSRADVAEILDSIDVMIVPSHTEGISNAALEAMAAGLPVVATAVDGNLEAVVPGETGLLVPPGVPQALAEAMLTYWENPQLVARHGRAARLRCDHVFGMARMIAEFERAYSEIVRPLA